MMLSRVASDKGASEKTEQRNRYSRTGSKRGNRGCIYDYKIGPRKNTVSHSHYSETSLGEKQSI